MTVECAQDEIHRIQLIGNLFVDFNNQMKQVIPHLEQNIKEIYRKAIDADAKLTELKKAGMGKFSALFQSDQLFTTKATSFQPYVEELASDINDFKSTPSEAKLQVTLQKMESLYKLLAQFQSIS